MALPALIATGIFSTAEHLYGSLGPAFFGLRTTFLVLLFMALWRIRRPEGLKEHSPTELGRVLGVDRAPEVKTLRRKRARLAACGRAAEFGRALANEEELRRTMRGFKIAHGKLGRQIWDAWQRVDDLLARRARIPRRVPVQSLTPEPVVKLAPEIKHLTNLVKMVAYQAESELVRTVAPHDRRVAEEGRTLIQAALLSAADLDVTAQELRVTLRAQSSPHRARAIAALCDELNALGTRFPGSRLRLRYAIRTVG